MIPPLLRAIATCGWLFCATAVSAGERLAVFVSILPQKYFVERVGGTEVEVSVLVGPGHSPETYEPTPQQMVRLNGARLFFRIGAPFEEAWMDRIRRGNPTLAILDQREGIELRKMESAGEADHADHAHTQGKDPHIWTSPPLVRHMAGQIRDALVAAAPDKQESFQHGYTALVAELDALDREIRERLRPLPERRFLVFHPAWGYFADAYGLQQISIEAEGKSPGPRTLAQLIDTTKASGIRLILVQNQFSDRSARAVAEAIGGRIEAVDPLAYDLPASLRRLAQLLAGDQP